MVRELNTMTLCLPLGNEKLEVWYYGSLLAVKGKTRETA
jgi:hypothetical protein